MSNFWRNLVLVVIWMVVTAFFAALGFSIIDCAAIGFTFKTLLLLLVFFGDVCFSAAILEGLRG